MDKGKDLLVGTLIRRYKRFLVEVLLDSGEKVTAHCNNSGSMISCLEPGAPVLLSKSSNPNRKTLFSWEMIHINNGWVGVNTLLPNQLVYDAIQKNQIEQLKGHTFLSREKRYGNSRIDIYIEFGTQKCFVEVKNVSMRDGSYARFPDSMTERGRKHLETLIRIRKAGHRSVNAFIIQRNDISRFGPAWNIDPGYSETLVKAFNSGVEIIPIMADIKPTGITLLKEIPYDLDSG